MCRVKIGFKMFLPYLESRSGSVVGELFGLKLRRRRFSRRARESSSLKRSGGCGVGCMTFMKHRKNVLGALVKDFFKICDFLAMIPSFGVL